MENAALKPKRAAGTRWISHKMTAMAQLVDKFGIYCHHLEKVVADTNKKMNTNARATVRGKLNQLKEAKVLLRSALFIDLLNPSKILSLVTQKRNAFIVDIVESVESTKRGYEKFLRKLQDRPDRVFELPTLKRVVAEIESDEDGEPTFQGVRLKNYIRDKSFIKNNVSIVQSIVTCFEQRYHITRWRYCPSSAIRSG